jgi:hypothetical protein
MTAPEALDQLRMFFLPVPQLRHDNPSTSFKIRGKQLTVDLLTTGNGKNENPVKVPLFQSEAMPLQYMTFLLEETVPTVAFDRKHIALVNVPDPLCDPQTTRIANSPNGIQSQGRQGYCAGINDP